MTQAPPDQLLPSTEIIAAVSVQEGAGTTTAVVNLALALAAAGRSVLLIDLDPKGRSSQMLGCESTARGGAERILLEASLDRDMVVETRIRELCLATAGTGLSRVESELAMMGDSQTRLYQALTKLSESVLHFEHVLLDCPASLDLLTRNALIAAHRVMVPLPCDTKALNGLPGLLTTINRLRAGLSHPLYGIHLLISGHDTEPASQVLVDRVRQDYGRMTLLSEIPADDAVHEATRQSRPLLIHAPRSEAGQALLSMASEWLTLGEPGNQPDGTWLFDARQARMEQHRERMLKGLSRWPIDRSSPLYDTDDVMRQQDAMALEALYQTAAPVRRIRLDWRPKRKTLQRGGLIAGIAIIILVILGWLSEADHRIDIAAGLVGSDHYWKAGSVLLSRADAVAYRELLFAVRLVEENREQLILCNDNTNPTSGLACMIHVPMASPRP
ncbi:ParA family protein [Thiorhodococcus mannitoliphagus]|uniref:ParA family protein n=1 Tax=Thiorhodococcus mannitoliphagus TaxID=329406 RepID=A0A6P1DTP7_9GAMM|nr:ParA family protein [Thiorhodococcus mannitoliphagus]NEX19412.1 ParA family protein [Thiorhodococcus mannitoliphagus]